MSVSDASITPTSAAQFIPEIWSDGVLEAVEFGATIQKRVNRRFETELKMGNTLTIPRLSNLSNQTKTAGIGNTITFEAITETNQTVTVATHQYAAFAIEAVTEVQTNQDLRAHYEKKIGYALARGTDIALANLFSSISNKTVGVLGQELVFDDFLSIWTAFSKAGLLEDSPNVGEDCSVFLSSSAYANLLKIDQFVNKDYAGDGSALERMNVGSVLSMPVYTSQLLNSPSTGQVHGAAFMREGFALVVQKEVPVVSQFLIRNLADGVVGWRLFGTAEMLFPPETPGGGTAVDNRNILVETIL